MLLHVVNICCSNKLSATKSHNIINNIYITILKSFYYFCFCTIYFFFFCLSAGRSKCKIKVRKIWKKKIRIQVKRCTIIIYLQYCTGSSRNRNRTPQRKLTGKEQNINNHVYYSVNKTYIIYKYYYNQIDNL